MLRFKQAGLWNEIHIASSFNTGICLSPGEVHFYCAICRSLDCPGHHRRRVLESAWAEVTAECRLLPIAKLGTIRDCRLVVSLAMSLP